MPLVDSIGIACFLMAVVFTVLFCIYFCIKLFSFAIRKLQNTGKKNNTTAEAARK